MKHTVGKIETSDPRPAPPPCDALGRGGAAFVEREKRQRPRILHVYVDCDPEKNLVELELW